MEKALKIGIIICDRYSDCAGGKCFRALKNREGAFSVYSKDRQVEVAAYTSCGGCPGGNIEYAPAEMIKNGVEVVHLATGFVVGYPPCPYIGSLKKFIEKEYGLKVIVGTHPIPEKYRKTHEMLKTWDSEEWQAYTIDLMADDVIRKAYN